jgi:serine/threonine protein kinase
LLLGEGYGSSVDIWALGVILYIMYVSVSDSSTSLRTVFFFSAFSLCGFQPFGAPNTAQLFSQIMAGKYKFIAPYWDKISEAAKDLVRNVLVVDPRRRFTARDILKHPFLQKAKK